MHEAIGFVVITLALAFVSRNSLLKPGVHGFYRFFAWECMLGLFVMNLRVWHDAPDSPRQLVAGTLFFCSLLLVLSGLVLLQWMGQAGCATRRRADVGF